MPTKCSQPIKTETSPKPKQRKHRLRRTTQNCGSTPRTDHRSCNAGASQRSRRTQTQTGTPPQGKGRDCCTPSNGNPKVAEPELNFEAKAPKTEPQAEAKAEKNIVPDESPILAEAADDFIPIEDLPTEKIELPSELIGKFEATKAETPATPTPAAAPAEPQQPQRPRLRARDNNNPYNNNTITTATVAITNSAPCSSALHNRITTERTIRRSGTQTRNRTREDVRIR